MIQLTPDEIAQVVLSRQRRRTWVPLLTGLTWLLWVGAAVWTVYLLVNIPAMIWHPGQIMAIPVLVSQNFPQGDPPDPAAPKLPQGDVVIIYDIPSLPRLMPARSPTAAESLRGHVNQSIRVNAGLRWAVGQLTGILAVLVLALMSTLSLLLAVRRATLRQIQASLAAIAGQLAEVQRGRGTMPPTAGG